MTRSNRRDLLKLLGAASLLPLLHGALPGGLRAHAQAAPGAAIGKRVLVLVELRGGNDGLATVVPHRDPALRSLRPNLTAPQESLLPIGGDLALHPALKPLMPAWDAGELAVVLGVGYPQPNRSHFRSIEIWETGSRSDEFLTEGWIARVLGGGSAGVADGIALADSRLGPLAGRQMRNLIIERPDQFAAQARRLRPAPESADGALGHVLRTRAELVAAADSLAGILERPFPGRVEFPQTQFGRQVATAARLIVSDARVPVLKLGLGSFDTHVNQRRRHDTLLEELAAGLHALRNSMLAAGRWNEVLVMTYSEFGRQVKENASRGSDHGSTAPQFLLGGAVAGGLHGAQPAVEEIDQDDPKGRVDFRDLYGAVARDWWGVAGARSGMGSGASLPTIVRS